MRIGCDLPFFVDPDLTRAFAERAESAGFDMLAMSEHVAASRATADPEMPIDAPWHESFTMFGFLAAITSRLELVTGMNLVTLRHPVLVAKMAAEVDLMSKGRLRLGVSVGWNREEQLAVGVDPATRGRRIEEMVPLMRRLWEEDAVTHDGEFFTLDQVVIRPQPGRRIPIWMGAGGGGPFGGWPTDRALDRAARLFDGFRFQAPSGRDVPRVVALAHRLQEMAAGYGRTIGIEARLLTQTMEPEQWPDAVAEYEASGVIGSVAIGNRIYGDDPVIQANLIDQVADRLLGGR